MADEHTKNVDRAVARALRDRIKAAETDADIEADLSKLRAITARTPDQSLAETLGYLIEHFGVDHAGTAKLKAELDGLNALVPEQKAQSKTSTANAVPSRDVIMLPHDIPDLSDTVTPDREAQWPVPVLFSADWRTLDNAGVINAAALASATFLDQFPPDVAAQTVAARQAALICYPGFHATELLVRQPDGHSFTHFALYGPDRALQISGTSPGIHMLNAGTRKDAPEGEPKRSPLDISSIEKASAYLCFFCGCVHGEEGGFFLIEDEAQLAERWSGAEVPEVVFESIFPIKFIPPTEIEGEVVREKEGAKANGKAGSVTNGKTSGVASDLMDFSKPKAPAENQRFDAVVLYSNAIFHASFSIQPSGMVEMLEDTPVAADLEVNRDGFIDGMRIAPKSKQQRH